MRGAPARVLAGAAVLAALAATPAPAAGPRSWEALAGEMAAPWVALQRADGSFPDYVLRTAGGRGTRDDYGEAMLGYGLLEAGIRTRDDALIAGGARAVTYTAARPERRRNIAMFRNVALAGAYNLARERIPEHPEFTRARATWERRLRGMRLDRLLHGTVTNKTLVEAVAVLELLRSGLRSRDRRVLTAGPVGSPARAAVLADPGRSRRLVMDLLARRLPRAAAPFDRRDGRAGRLSMLGDYPNLPLAYHALATGFLARAVELLGPDAPARARRLLREAAGASWALAAPDGDLSYFGRSQEQAWTLSLSAYGAEVAAGSAGPAVGRLQALSERAVGRLDGAYTVGPDGLFVVPALAQDLRRGVRALDSYAAAASYSGLTLVALNWAIAAPGAAAPPAGTGADSDGSFVLGTGRATFAAVRAGDVWFAVKQAHAPEDDLRSDFGLVALKVRAGDGSWQDLLPLRPRVEGRRDSAGPILRRGRRRALPEGRALRVNAAGRVGVTAGYRALRRRVAITFRPSACGVEIALRGRSGDEWELSWFLPGPVRVEERSISGQGREIAFDRPARTSLERGYSSATEPALTRARARLAPAAGRLAVTVCRSP
jgi:hypothetical protein